MPTRPLSALLSVSDKSGLVEFALGLHAAGVRLVSTGGTARALADAGLPVTEVAEITGFPEMLDGRVKTLHPRIHAGLLARRDLPEHMASLQAQGIGIIDLLVVNLYPFQQATAREGCTLEEAIENIDIGGPAMLRAAAKNWAHVGVLCDPADYAAVLEEVRAGALQDRTRFRLAHKAFAHTAAYDGMIANCLTALPEEAHAHPGAVLERGAYPRVLTQQWHKTQEMRYGENPHQSAAFYREAAPAAGLLARWVQHQGKELSFNNIADADAAWECVKSFGTEVACVIVKHANPCGVGTGATPAEAYAKALKTDPTSAFGGIVAFNRPLDAAAAEAMQASKQFVEVLVAPGYSEEARGYFAGKANLRLLEVPLPTLAAGATGAAAAAGPIPTNAFDFKRVGGGLLVQAHDAKNVAAAELRVVTRVAPTAAQMADLLFAWKVAKFVKSNAIIYAAGGMTLGIGAGQMSRVDSARIASIKAEHAGLPLAGSAVASDAFFPFRDGLDEVVNHGAACVIQPGGSLRDEEVIAAANERGVAMVFTGTRHFRH